MKIRTSTLIELKKKGVRFAALTSYDMHTASIFDGAGIVSFIGRRFRKRQRASLMKAQLQSHWKNNPIWKGSCEKR